jgi:4,5-DOPA dioxygenase extradiol
MRRRSVIKAAALAPIGVAGMSALERALGGEARSERMPVMFVGHGSPMNAILDNRWSRAWVELGAVLRRPNAILCVSAHWQTTGSMVTAMERPRTIHDFYGFPDELNRTLYPAPGAPEVAGQTKALVKKTPIGLDAAWGLDHGTWSVLVRMFPRADVPVFQLSLDHTQGAAWHYELARELRPLRDRGVLIMGSGNIVHNLRRVDGRLGDAGFDWAVEFDAKAKALIDSGDHRSLVEYEKLGSPARLSIPTNEHYLPVLYALAVKDDKDSIAYFNDGCAMGSISMRSLVIG